MSAAECSSTAFLSRLLLRNSSEVERERIPTPCPWPRCLPSCQEHKKLLIVAAHRPRSCKVLPSSSADVTGRAQHPHASTVYIARAGLIIIIIRVKSA